MPSFPMADGVDAEFTYGSYHVVHKGTTYLNYDTATWNPIRPFIFTNQTTGSLDDNETMVVEDGQYEKKYLMPKAKIITIKFGDGSEASYLEGGTELNYKGDKYLLMDEQPLFSRSFPKLETSGVMKGTTKFLVSTSTGIRGRRYNTFELEGEDSSKKRKQFDLGCEEKYEKSQKQALVVKKRRPEALELAQKALKCVEDLIAFEKEVCEEAGVDDDDTVFEDDSAPLCKAITALSRVIRIATVHVVEAAESDADE
jgi:hypothetical protein